MKARKHAAHRSAGGGTVASERGVVAALDEVDEDADSLGADANMCTPDTISWRIAHTWKKVKNINFGI